MGSQLRVAICGGGNLAHVMAAVIGGLPGIQLRVLTRHPDVWASHVTADYRDMAVRGSLQATVDPARAVSGADLILIAVPASARRGVLAAIAPHVETGTCVGALPAVGAFDHEARELLGERIILFGSSRSPYNCRVRDYGSSVTILGILPFLQVAVTPAWERTKVEDLLDRCLGIPTSPVEEFLALTLSPAGTIFHPARIGELIRLHPGGAGATWFYEEWGDSAAATFFACDAELDALSATIGISRYGMSARDHYGTEDPALLAALLRSLEGLRGIEVPTVSRDGRRELDGRSRFVTEDVPFGLAVAARVAELSGVAVPHVAALLNQIRGHFGNPPELELPPHLARLERKAWLTPI